MSDAKCGECDHTEKEHEAFDAGVRAGEKGHSEDVPEMYEAESEAWLSGYSVTRFR